MKLTKETCCEVHIGSNDAVCDITVDGSIKDNDKLGTFVEDGVPKIICNRLHISSGATVKNIHVCSGGYMDARDAILSDLHVGRGGEATIWGGTVTDIYEFCGCVELMDYNEQTKPVASFVPMTHSHVHEHDVHVYIHSGTRYEDGSLRDGSIMVLSGGELRKFVAYNTYVTVKSGGICDQLIVGDQASLRPSGGMVTNAEIRSGGILTLCMLDGPDFENHEPLLNTSNITISSGGTAVVRYCEGEQIPDYSSLHLEDGACVEEIMLTDDDYESSYVRYMDGGHLVAYVEANPNTDKEN